MTDKPKRAGNRGTRHGNGMTNSTGWGGPAKGASRAKPRAEPITPENARIVRLPAPPLAIKSAEERAAATAVLHGVMYSIATDEAEAAQGRIAAAVALDNRLNGTPVARVEHSGGMTLTHEARAALAANARARYAGDEGTDGS